MTIQTTKATESDLKKVKNSVIGNPLAKDGIVRNEELMRRLIEFIADSENDIPEEVKVKAAHIVASFSYGSEIALSALLKLNTLYVFVFALSNLFPEGSTTLRAAYARALRALVSSIADVVGPSEYGAQTRDSSLTTTGYQKGVGLHVSARYPRRYPTTPPLALRANPNSHRPTYRLGYPFFRPPYRSRILATSRRTSKGTRKGEEERMREVVSLVVDRLTCIPWSFENLRQLDCQGLDHASCENEEQRCQVARGGLAGDGGAFEGEFFCCDCAGEGVGTWTGCTRSRAVSPYSQPYEVEELGCTACGVSMAALTAIATLTLFSEPYGVEAGVITCFPRFSLHFFRFNCKFDADETCRYVHCEYEEYEFGSRSRRKWRRRGTREEDRLHAGRSVRRVSVCPGYSEGIVVRGSKSPSWSSSSKGQVFEIDEAGEEEEGEQEQEEDRRVLNAALAALCNIVMEFSPLRPIYLEHGLMPRLVQLLLRSGDGAIRMNALWAIKNLLYKSSTETKRNVMRELGWTQVFDLLHDPDLGIQEQAYHVVRNLSESEEGIEMVFRELGVDAILDSITESISVEEKGLMVLTTPVSPTSPSTSISGSAIPSSSGLSSSPSYSHPQSIQYRTPTILQALSALANLCNGPHHYTAQILAKPRLLTNLKTCLAERGADIRKVGVGCVLTLVQEHPRKRRVFVDAGVVGTLRRLSSSYVRGVFDSAFAYAGSCSYIPNDEYGDGYDVGVGVCSFVRDWNCIELGWERTRNASWAWDTFVS
ncbi:hypothetical protein MD484_g8193, partial [Candolleomyces efflorescens]